MIAARRANTLFCYTSRMRRSWKALAIGVLTLSILLGGAFGDRLLALTDEARDGLRLYTELLTVAQESYGAEVEFRDLVYASIQGMLRTLDPHTSFLPPEAYDSMRDRQQTSFYGLGILVGIRNGELTVISPLEGTPGGPPRHPRRRRDLDDRGRAHRDASASTRRCSGSRGPRAPRSTSRSCAAGWRSPCR